MNTVHDERHDILSGTQVSVNFRGLKALQQVDIHVPEGAIVGLVGPNGAGKSTLLGVLSGDVIARAGTVRLGGRDVSGLGPEARVRHGLARTFQLPELFDELTVREHLLLARRLAQTPSRSWSDPLTGRFLRQDAPEDQEVDALLDSLGLAQVAGTPAGTLPLGLCRLVEIARAAASHPRVILLDEPFSGLNPAESKRLSEALAGLNRTQGIAMVLVEHDVEIVFGLSERVFVLDFGVIIAAGTPGEIQRDPSVRAAYLGDVSPAAAGVSGTADAPAPEGDRPAVVTGPAAATGAAVVTGAEAGTRPAVPGPRGRGDILSVSDLSLKYADATALHEVSFSVAPRSVTALLGPNGAGKSSVARAVSGLVRAQSGLIRFDGADITGVPADRIRRLGIAYLPEGRGVFRSLTVEENLRVALSGVPKGERAAAIEGAIDLFPVLRQRRRQTAGTLSGGEQQMLSLARVLTRQPRLLIADEISLGLAPLIVEEVFAGLNRVIELGVSVILIEQFVHRALAIADRCYVLRRGRVVWSGEAAEAGADLVEHYLGGGNLDQDRAPAAS
ncbi:MAG TPA: ATP-binding cassette domain-containing protein [Trebonia sp.]|nr:ATP-binding cassette domain-containing protein [Trebonia sp.]